MSDDFILDGVRTPIGRYGGALPTVRPDNLAAHMVRCVVERTGGRRGLATMCVGVGQGSALLLERP